MNSIMKIEDRFGEPDFQGEWEINDTGASGEFKLFILEKAPLQQVFQEMYGSLYRTIYGNRSIRSNQELQGIEVFEAVSKDEFGLAAISGKEGKNRIEFTKHYSNLASKKGGFSGLFFSGFMKNGGYEGCFERRNNHGLEISENFYNIPERDVYGNFWVKKTID